MHCAWQSTSQKSQSQPNLEDNGDAIGVFTGDTPAFLKFIPKMGKLQRFVHQKNPDTIGHTEIIGSIADKDCSVLVWLVCG